MSDSHIESNPDGDHNPNEANSDRQTGSVTRRVVYSLALLPIVPAISMLGAVVLAENDPSSAFDTRRFHHFVFATLWVAMTILIWRSFVVWTLGRKWLTAMVSVIPFVQVIIAQPLWNAQGCASNDILCEGQHELLVSLWIWICIWVWWAWEKKVMKENDDSVSYRMSPVAKRLIASIATIPFCFGIFLIAGVGLEDFMGMSDPVTEALALSALVAITLWIVIWQRTIRWSPQVITKTVVLAILSLALPLLLQFLFMDDADGLFEVFLGVLPVIGWGGWMASTIAIWPTRPELAGVGSVQPRCLGCGYLLTGLTSTRCPECGNQPTLDQLWAGNTGGI